MRGNVIQNLSGRAEFIIVALLAFSYPALSSFLSLISSASGRATPSFYTNDIALLNMFYQVLFLAVIWAFLRARGWQISDLGPRVSWKTVGAGILVFGLTFLIFTGGTALLSTLLTEERIWEYGVTHKNLNAIIALLFLTVNSIYEEGLVTGYVVTALSKTQSVSFAINVSTGIRFLYHLYQGPMVVATIIPMGLMYGYIYARWKRLTPLIVGHTLINLIWFISG